ncbi:serine protease inhibitor [Kitasatospora aureofaciens]|uniref:serine protease inhibitor n=1 Tax=Kitasatospora aureofaciens TaxID=1894 RepID=UPI001C4710BD|nr:serine protease inhibitor [Kitasatospora aureofaciens]MBV6695608.1 serine protease inhibitor [Kitasatospora aureofaciens]
MTDDDDFDLASLRSWPHLVGVDVDEARAVIEAEDPDLHVGPVPTDHDVTCDFWPDRVWLWFDPDTRLVSQTPRVG